MAMQTYAMPAVCRQCGELFDMSFDFMKNKIGEGFEEVFSRKNKKNTLCWECRYSS